VSVLPHRGVTVPGVRIPLADAGALAEPLRRMRRVRFVLAAALLAGGAAAVMAARALPAPTAAPVAGRSTGVVVVDISASIGAATDQQTEAYEQIGGVLENTVARGGNNGLVLFSDVAYEALPTTAGPGDLRAFERYFFPIAGQGRAFGTVRFSRGTFAANPWTEAFVGGTRISNGLQLAREMLERDRVRDPSVTLVSDLDTDDSDVAGLSKVVIGYVRAGIPLRVVPIAAEERNKTLFRNLLGRDGTLAEPPAPRPQLQRPESTGSRSPAALIALSIGLLGLLAVNELWCGRIALRRVEGEA
jgi:hypothetical protein